MGLADDAANAQHVAAAEDVGPIRRILDDHRATFLGRPSRLGGTCGIPAMLPFATYLNGRIALAAQPRFQWITRGRFDYFARISGKIFVKPWDLKHEYPLASKAEIRRNLPCGPADSDTLKNVILRSWLPI
jgi:hypothetical protein